MARLRAVDLVDTIEAALDAYADTHDGGTSHGAAWAVLDALRDAPPEVVANALTGLEAT